MNYITDKMKDTDDSFCGGTISRNNSNWESVAYSSVQSASSCAVTISTNFNRQKRVKDDHRHKRVKDDKVICQVRSVKFNVELCFLFLYGELNNLCRTSDLTFRSVLRNQMPKVYATLIR